MYSGPEAAGTMGIRISDRTSEPGLHEQGEEEREDLRAEMRIFIFKIALPAVWKRAFRRAGAKAEPPGRLWCC